MYTQNKVGVSPIYNDIILLYLRAANGVRSACRVDVFACQNTFDTELSKSTHLSIQWATFNAGTSLYDVAEAKQNAANLYSIYCAQIFEHNWASATGEIMACLLCVETGGDVVTSCAITCYCRTVAHTHTSTKVTASLLDSDPVMTMLIITVTRRTDT